MRNSMIKRNLRSILIILAAAMVFVSTWVFARPAKAAGNDAGYEGVQGIFMLVLDVNGKEPEKGTTEYDRYVRGTEPAHAFDENNGKGFRTRVINANALYGQNDQGGIPVFIRSSIVNSSPDFTVDLNTSDTNASEDTQLKVEAKAITEKPAGAGYFSVQVKKSSTAAPETKYFKVIVNDTLRATSSVVGDDKSLIVGYPVDTSSAANKGKEIDRLGNPITGSSYDTVKKAHPAVVTFRNYTTVTIDLDTLLKGRALYSVNPDDDAGNKSPLKDNGAIWTVKSVKNLKITDVVLESMSNLKLVAPLASSSNPGTPPVRITPTYTGRIEVPTDIIDTFNDKNKSKGIDFWTTTHTMKVSLEVVTSLTTDTQKAVIYIPFEFKANNPQKINISSSRLRLNMTSQNEFDLKNTKVLVPENATNVPSGGETGAEGDSNSNAASNASSDYCSIYIRPSDLIDYSTPSGYPAMYFEAAGTRLNGKNDLKLDLFKIEGAKYNAESTKANKFEPDTETLIPTVYKITAVKPATMEGKTNSTYVIRFKICYYTGVDKEETKEVDISMMTYGDYVVKFSDINGKRPVTLNVQDNLAFDDMRKNGYMLTDAWVKAEYKDVIAAKVEQNVLKLTPRAKEDTDAVVTLKFTNNSRQVVVFDSQVFSVNTNAGNLENNFDTWEIALIYTGAGIGLLIILLIIILIFIRALSRKRQDELAMQAPVSSYIVKLNSQIAATQAQSRMAQTAALSQASAQMLLGAGPAAGVAPLPDTLQLATGLASAPGSTPGTSAPGVSAPGMSSPSQPMMSEPQAAVPPDGAENYDELIAKYISDDELLERIFKEKYEPKGMVRRTFFKSKDTQARELEKEKKRIIERYKTPMPMDEAIMSEQEIKNAAASSTPSTGSAPQEVVEQPKELFVLDFDPDAPLFVEGETGRDEFSDEKIDLDLSPEESKLKSVEHRTTVLEKELKELASRLSKVQSEVIKAKSMEDELREKIAKAEADIEQYAKDIEDLEFKQVSAKNKDKPIIARDISVKEEKKKRTEDELAKLRAELDRVLSSSERVTSVHARLTEIQAQKESEKESVKPELEKAKAEYAAYSERMEQLRQRHELEAKVEQLVPMLEAVNKIDYELKSLDVMSEAQLREREALKADIAQYNAQIVSGAVDFKDMADLNEKMSAANGRLTELEREISKTNKAKSDLQIELKAQRRKANDYIDKNDIPCEDVVAADDKVLGALEFEIVKATREKDIADAEQAVANAEVLGSEIAMEANNLTSLAAEDALGLEMIKQELEAAQAQLDEINANLESASEDEKLDLLVQQGDATDKVEEIKARLMQANVDGTKRRMDAQADIESRRKSASDALTRAEEDLRRAQMSYDELLNSTNPIDLVVSGSGLISQDRKKSESENLKKQLERSRLEAEQARLAAQQAQEKIEEERRKAHEEAEKSKLEAERLAQEAIDRAEQARLEAEEKAKADIEAAEQARKATEEALAAETEEAKRKAEEDAEEARRRAMDEVEAAKRKAEEDAQNAKLAAQKEIDEMRRKAEEDAEAKRLEEENQRKDDAARQKAESERQEAIAKKVSLRKDQIVAIRNEMKEIKGDEDARNLRERLVNLQVTFDDDERNSSDLMNLYNKTLDDIQNSGEIARLKAENAKKPQRVVHKVTERVNRIARPRPGAPRPGAPRPGAPRPGAPRPGAPRPGAPRPGAPRPGAPRPGAPRPGAPRPGAPRPGAPRPGAPRR